jgi:hypothetical protein
MTGGGWQFFQTDGAPAYSRLCVQSVVVPAGGRPGLDLCSTLPNVGPFALAMYAESQATARLARTMELQAGPMDMRSFGSIHKKVKRSTRNALVQGDLRIADGRSDPAFIGGHARLVDDFGRWRRGECPDVPIQIRRLSQLEAAGIDAVDFPSSAAVDLRFGLQLARPVVICKRRFREAEEARRVQVTWLP